MKFSAPPAISTSWTAPTILMITAGQLKELELSAPKSLFLLRYKDIICFKMNESTIDLNSNVVTKNMILIDSI